MAKSLKTITKQIAARHKAKGKAETALKKARGEFFDVATAATDNDDLLARKTLRIAADNEIQARSHLEREYPGWIILELLNEDEEHDGSTDMSTSVWLALIKEDPALQPFTFVHPELDLVFERQVRAGSIQFDDERLKKENPDLYKKVTKQVRVPVDFDSLDEDTLADVAPYIFRGPPTVALPAPRKAKEEDLAS